MSTRVAAYIHIGGDFPRSLLPLLCDAVHMDALGSGNDYSGSFEETEFRTEEDVHQEINSRGYLSLTMDEAPNGVLEMLEPFLERYNVPYNRYAAGSSGDFAPEIAFFRPGTGSSDVLITDDGGDPIVSASVVIDAYEALLVGNVHAALTVLATYQNHKVPPLPSFKIVEG